MSSHDRVVVVGGGIGGVATAAALRAGGYSGEIVLVDRGELPYDRPPLSKEYLAGDRGLEDIALQQPEWYAEQRIDLWALSEVAELVLADDEVEVVLADGRRVHADQVVLATGGRPAVPPVPGLVDAFDRGAAHVLRDAGDADRLRAVLRPGARLLVVGGGLIGAEVASTARRLGCSTTVVDPLDPPLVAAAGPAVATWLHEQHGRHGVETVVSRLESVQPGGGGVAAQLHGEQDSRRFDAVLVGVGMVPSTELAESAGLEVDRGVLVDDEQRTSHPRVFAVGDSARPRDHHRAEHWEAAQHDGQRAAAAILVAEPPAASASWWWSDRHGSHVEGVGEMATPDGVTTVVLRGSLEADGGFASFTVRGGRVVGAVAVDDSPSVRAARRLIDRGVPVDPAQLADPGTDLRKLVRR